MAGTDRGENPARPQGAAHDVRYVATTASVLRAFLARLEENRVEPLVQQPPRHVAVASAHVEDRPGRWMAPDRCDDAIIPVAKPEGAVLDVEEDPVPPLRVGNLGLNVGGPDFALQSQRGGNLGYLHPHSHVGLQAPLAPTESGSRSIKKSAAGLSTGGQFL